MSTAVQKRSVVPGDGLSLQDEVVAQRLRFSVRRDVVAFLADLLDNTRADRAAGAMAFNLALNYAPGTVGAALKAIFTGVGAGQPWADLDALVADLAGRLGPDQLTESLRERIDLIDAEGTGLVDQVLGLVGTYGSTVDAAASATAAALSQTAAVQASVDAAVARDAASVSAGQALTRAEAAETSRIAAQTAAGEASVQASSAATSATSAAGAVSSASTQAALAATAASTAGASATAAVGSASTAQSAATAASNSAAAADSSRVAAASSAGQASVSASSAAGSATSAAGSASAASTAATVAAQASDDAEQSAVSSASSAMSAATSASNASGAVSTATTQAAIAVAAANTASGSATAAANSASTAQAAASGASTSATSAETSSLSAASSAASANESRSAATTAASNASGSASSASNSASLASNSANAAGVSASSAVNSASTAQTAATAAGNSAVAANASRLQAQTAASDASTSSASAASAATAADGSASAAASHFENTVAATGSLTASVSALSTAVAGPNGVAAQYVLKVATTRTDGKKVFAAIGLASEATGAAGESQILLQADKLLFVPPGAPNDVPVQFLTLGFVNGVLTLIVPAARIGDNSLGPGKLAVSALSAITANVGELTAGVIRNGADTYRVDVTNGRTIVRTGAAMKVSGAPFGSAGQFIEWYGPYFADLASCTEANGTYWLKTNGSAYFGGSLSAGVLKNAAQTTSVVSNAEVIVGPFLTNGGTKTITLSFGYSRDYQCNANTGSISGSGGATVVLEKSIDGGAWSTISTLNAGETVRQVTVNGEPGVPDQVNYSLGGATTLNDSQGATSNMRLRARLTSRTAASLGGSGIFGLVETQTISVLCIE